MTHTIEQITTAVTSHFEYVSKRATKEMKRLSENIRSMLDSGNLTEHTMDNMRALVIEQDLWRMLDVTETMGYVERIEKAHACSPLDALRYYRGMAMEKALHSFERDTTVSGHRYHTSAEVMKRFASILTDIIEHLNNN